MRKHADIWEKAKDIGAAVTLAVGTALAGRAVDSAASTISDYLEHRSARNAIINLIDAMPEHKRLRIFGETPKEEFLQRFDTLYRISPEYMKDPSLALHAIHKTMAYGDELGTGITPDAAREFIDMSSSLARASSREPGMFESVASGVGKDLARELLNAKKQELEDARKKVTEEARHHLNIANQLDREIINNRMALEMLDPNANPKQVQELNRRIEVGRRYRDRQRKRYEQSLSKTASSFSQYESLGVEPDFVGDPSVPEEVRLRALKAAYEDHAASLKKDVEEWRRVNANRGMILTGIGGALSGGALGAHLGDPKNYLRNLALGSVIGGIGGGVVGRYVGGAAGQRMAEIVNDSIDEAARRADLEEEALRAHMYALQHERATQDQEQERIHQRDIARASAPRVYNQNYQSMNAALSAEKRAAVEFVSVFVQGGFDREASDKREAEYSQKQEALKKMNPFARLS